MLETSSDNQHGYTLIELLLAMALFSFMLMIIVGGFLNIVHLYQNSQTSRSTQHDARFAMEEMIRTARSSSTVQADPGGGFVCFFGVAGSHRFDINAAKQLERVALAGAQQAATCALEPQEGTPPLLLTSGDVHVVSLAATVMGTGAADSFESVQLTVKVTGAVQNTLNVSQSGCSTSEPFCSLTVLTSTASLRGAAK